MMRSILPVLALLCMATVSRAQVANIADPRLQIELPTVKGDKISLSSLKGKVILLDFWASWCMPCRSANKKLVKLYDKYKSKGFEIYSVSLDDEKKDWEKAIRQDKISWLQVNEPTVWGAESARRWNISALPTTFLINKKGDVVAINIEGKELDKEIARLLAE
ncbi:MAG TPA: TlpA disulfide reductase family protein [Chitinophagaceae bacterium]|nr:TlpA disulfide reductase family protein [Chitinophagaceae bacterium]